MECVQTDNGFEFQTGSPTASGICLPCLKLPPLTWVSVTNSSVPTPRHNGKVERGHREDQKRFYSSHSFYTLDDFAKQLAIHNHRSNNFHMRPLGWLSPLEFIVQYVWQTYKPTVYHGRSPSGPLKSDILITGGTEYKEKDWTPLCELSSLSL